MAVGVRAASQAPQVGLIGPLPPPAPASTFDVYEKSIVDLLAAKSIGILKTQKIAEQLRNDGFEVLANGPDGMRKRIADEVPKWREIIAKAGIKPV